MLLRTAWLSYSLCYHQHVWVAAAGFLKPLRFHIFQDVLHFCRVNKKSQGLQALVTLNECSWEWRRRPFAMPAACGDDTQTWLQPNMWAERQLCKEKRRSQDVSSLHILGSLQYLCQCHIFHVFFLIILNQRKEACAGIKFGLDMDVVLLLSQQVD